jgi:acetolactate synthase I/II/III large subunit
MAPTTPGEPVRSAQKIVDVLSAQGVEYIFGVPGAKIDPVYDALVDGGPELVVCRHEQTRRSWPARSVASPATPVWCW